VKHSEEEERARVEAIKASLTGNVFVRMFVVIGAIIGIFILVNMNTGSSPTDKNPNIAKGAPWVWCTEYVKKRLASPASADFPSVWTRATTASSKITKLSDDRYMVSSYVDSQNLFGANVRSNFTCILKRESEDYWKLMYLNVAGITYRQEPPESTPKSTASEIRKATRGSCPAATLYAKSRVNIRGGPGLNENIVRKASRGEALRCDYSQGVWYRLVTHRTKEEWVHSSVVSPSNPVHLPAKKQEACYELGVRYGRCASSALVGRRCNPADDIVKPKRCMGDPSFDRGIEASARQVLKR